MHVLTTARSALAGQASGRKQAEEHNAKLRHALRSAHAAAEVATVTAEAQAHVSPPACKCSLRRPLFPTGNG